MSTEHEHGHGTDGGHELEAMNTSLLFRLMISLSLVTLLASMAVVQWYYSQRAELEYKHAVEGSFALENYKLEMDKGLDGVDVVRRAIVADRAVLLGAPPPPGWVHPDDLLTGGAPAPAPTPATNTPAQDPAIVVTPGDKPADEKPADEKPADEKPADEKPAEKKPADDEKKPNE